MTRNLLDILDSYKHQFYSLLKGLVTIFTCDPRAINLRVSLSSMSTVKNAMLFPLLTVSASITIVVPLRIEAKYCTERSIDTPGVGCSMSWVISATVEIESTKVAKKPP